MIWSFSPHEPDRQLYPAVKGTPSLPSAAQSDWYTAAVLAAASRLDFERNQCDQCRPHVVTIQTGLHVHGWMDYWIGAKRVRRGHSLEYLCDMALTWVVERKISVKSCFTNLSNAPDPDPAHAGAVTVICAAVELYWVVFHMIYCMAVILCRITFN